MCKTLTTVCCALVSVSIIAFLLLVAVVVLAVYREHVEATTMETTDSPDRSNKMLKTLVNLDLGKMLEPNVTMDHDRESRDEKKIISEDQREEKEKEVLLDGDADGDDHDDQTAYTPVTEKDTEGVRQRRKRSRNTNFRVVVRTPQI